MIHRPVAIGLSVCEQVIVEEKTRNVTGQLLQEVIFFGASLRRSSEWPSTQY